MQHNNCINVLKRKLLQGLLPGGLALGAMSPHLLSQEGIMLFLKVFCHKKELLNNNACHNKELMSYSNVFPGKFKMQQIIFITTSQDTEAPTTNEQTIQSEEKQYFHSLILNLLP